MAVAIALPAVVCRTVTLEPDEVTPADTVVDPPVERERLSRLRPDWILIGNSMLNSRIDWRYLSEISGRKARKVSQGGTQSAIWFLFLKKIVVASEARPQWVTVFFRDTDLSWPDFRISGQNEDLIKRLDGARDPAWKQVIATHDRRRGLTGLTQFALGEIFPGKELNASARKNLQDAAFDLTDWGAGIERGVRRGMLNEFFSLEHLRGDFVGEAAASRADAVEALPANQLPDPGMYDEAPMTFDPSPSASFLPHMIALAKEHGFKLHFHRIKRRPAPDGSRGDSRLLQIYMSDLRSYLENEGCVLTDETPDRSIGLDMYGSGDHVSDQAQQRYMDGFWQKMRPIIGEGRRSGTL